MKATKERNCLACPAFYKCDKENMSTTAGGWEDKQIDRKTVICCRPAEKPSAKRKMTQYGLYCLATPTGKKIAHLASWTGRTPTWCPLGRDLSAGVEEVLENGRSI